ncbi:winged helix-turn-helix domain-containing protein [Nitrosopumilus sp.]|uniref:winged helix-turn-helix domain-containing protein n=1 Tax=Nitrosopumilus sp. TaxID=2024843 RepID=UPI00349FEA28
MTNNKKSLKRINHAILDRLVRILYENGHCRRTTIARKSNMSYDNCVSYLEFLEKFGVLRKMDDNGSEIIALTKQGMKMHKIKLNVITCNDKKQSSAVYS